MSDVISDALVQSLVPILAALVLALIGWATNQARTYLAKQTAKVQNDILRGALEHLTLAATTAAQETAQVAVDQLKAAAADGKLTAAEAKAALNAATNRAWQLLSAEVRKILIELAGGSQSAAIEQIVKPAIEAAVRQTKERPVIEAAPVSDAVRAREVALAQARLGLQ